MKMWAVGVLDWGPKHLPLAGGTRFTLRAADRGHIKRSASVAAAAEGFDCVSYSNPPLLQHWLWYCVMLHPSWADMLLEQHALYKSNEAWISCVKWWIWGQTLPLRSSALLLTSFAHEVLFILNRTERISRLIDCLTDRNLFCYYFS